MSSSVDVAWYSEDIWTALSDDLSHARHEIALIAPFVGHEPVDQLLAMANAGVGITLITTLDAASLTSGALSLDALSRVAAYPTGAVRTIPRLHAKIYVVDWMRCWWGSANFTSSGLGISEPHNLELLCKMTPIPSAAQQIFRTVLLRSSAVTQERLSALERILQRTGGPSRRVVDPELREACRQMSRSGSAVFLFQQLPFADSAMELLQESVGSEKARHDFMILGLVEGDDLEANLGRCRERYRQIPIVEALLDLLVEPRHFGHLTKWLHDRCEDRPVPYRSDVKDLLNRTLDWLLELYPDEVVRDRPGEKSARYRRLAD